MNKNLFKFSKVKTYSSQNPVYETCKGACDLISLATKMDSFEAKIVCFFYFKGRIYNDLCV